MFHSTRNLIFTSKRLRHAFLFLATGLTAGPMLAQPSLSGTTPAIQIGKTLTTYSVDASNLQPGVSGPDVTWDFSNLTQTATVSKTIVDPANTTYAVYFEEANLCFENSDGKMYYYTVNNQEYQYHGTFDGTYVIWGDLEDPTRLLNYPYSFGDSHQDTYTNQYNTGLAYYRSGNISVVADAWGDIQLPYGTVENVLRLRLQETFTDSLSFGFGTNYTSETYIWYKPGLFHNVFFLNTTTVNGNSTTSAAYLDQTTTSIDDLAATPSGLKVFPNPAQGQVQVEIELPQSGQATVSVTDLSGRLVLNQSWNGSPGRQWQTLSLDDLNRGAYLVSVSTEAGSQTAPVKLIVQ